MYNLNNSVNSSYQNICVDQGNVMGQLEDLRIQSDAGLVAVSNYPGGRVFNHNAQPYHPVNSLGHQDSLAMPSFSQNPQATQLNMPNNVNDYSNVRISSMGHLSSRNNSSMMFSRNTPNSFSMMNASFKPERLPVSADSFYDHKHVDAVQKPSTSAPSWVLYPHASHMSAPVDAKSSQFFRHPEKTITNAEKNFVKMILSRLQNMNLSSDLGDFDITEMESLQNRYVDWNPIEPYPSKSNPQGSMPPCSSLGVSYPTMSFKAYSLRDEGLVHARIVLGAGLTHMNCHDDSPGFRYMKQELRKLNHPSLIVIKDVFMTDAVEKNSICLIADFVPSVLSIQHTHLNDDARIKHIIDNHTKVLNESHLLFKKRAYDLFTQLVSALKYLHDRNIPFGSMHASKVLLQDGQKIYFTSVGARELLLHDPNETAEAKEARHREIMRSDLNGLGKLMLAICFGSFLVLNSPQLLQQSRVLMEKKYHKSFCTLVWKLLDQQISSIDEVVADMGHIAMEGHLNLAQHCSMIESFALKEVLNGRLFRLLAKLNTIVSQSSDTQGKQLIQHFMNFVFCQRFDNNTPFVDLAHIITCLNKLESGSNDKILLVTPDNQLLISKYSDIFCAVEKEFNRIVEGYERELVGSNSFSNSSM